MLILVSVVLSCCYYEPLFLFSCFTIFSSLSDSPSDVFQLPILFLKAIETTGRLGGSRRVNGRI
ncbi:hypothetical protein ARMGADRAFT_594460 [Armillaria gallica]|uniref:Uncharacterized protein n=1 Tax=Armillaria gallica TaxID=47427 RepID=A0A2H3CPK0_ARMGA|nr:hypothetical protein ARMGADRAFT_594460 [Armillaria gallica]